MQLTLRDVVGILNVPESTIFRWIAEKQLPMRQINGQYRFNAVQVFEWATFHHVDVVPKAFAQFMDEEHESVRFDTALAAGGIHPGIRGNDAATIVRQMVAVLPLPESFDRENLAQLILARNGLRATAIGEGIALPHPRLPIVIPGRPAAVSLCFLESPLPLDTGDRKPIDTLFLLQCPTVRAHLKLLARLAFASRDVKFRELIRRRAPAAEILAETHRIEEAFRTTTGNGNGEHAKKSA